MKHTLRSIRFFLSCLIGIAAVGAGARAGEVQEALRASYTAEGKGNYGEALRIMQGFQVKEARNYFVQIRLAYLNLMLGKYAESLASYQAAAQLDSRAVEPFLGGLKCAMALGKWGEAEQWANDVLKKDGSNYTALGSLAYACFARKDYAKAAKYYEQVVTLYPSDLSMKTMLAWSVHYQGFKSKAHTLFGEVLDASPDNASAIQGLKASE